MFGKKKLNFWRLAFLFTGFVFITLMALWNAPSLPKAPMMNETMGNIMKKQHLTNITIYDLMTKNETKDNSGKVVDSSASHHQAQVKNIVRMNYWTTAIIFLLLPIIIGGSIILAIVWSRWEAA